MSNEYEAKKQARIDRYADRAEKVQTQAGELFSQARQAIAGIEPGQPILVDHHSEGKHRRALARHDRQMGRGVEAQGKAEYWAHKAAAAAANTAISADDPQALDKLRAKLEKLTQAQEAMKRINRAYKAGKLADLGYSAEEIAVLEQGVKAGYSWDQQPYPAYQLKNNNANMRRIRQRIDELEQRAGQEETREMVNGVEIVQDVAANRTRLYFPGVPEKAVRRVLQGWSFRWAPSAGCWQRRLSVQALHSARQAAEQYRAA
ncbi:MAG: DUF3560 domain-containing protein [Candidatus Latescibacteria bacterium]|nr:DUF3560 domain-containing protein [Candidatus Latescibacterota bacterium]